MGLAAHTSARAHYVTAMPFCKYWHPDEAAYCSQYLPFKKTVRWYRSSHQVRRRGRISTEVVSKRQLAGVGAVLAEK
jgi:hypothetical protein